MRKKLFLCISMICLSFVLLFSACKDDEGPKVEQVEPPKEEVTLNKTDINLCIGDQMYLIPNGATNASLQVIFISSAPNVATVDNKGLVTAQNVGETTITITYGASTTSCKIIVGTNNYFPSMHFNHIASDEISVSILDQVNLTSYVKFNGQRFEDGTFTYSIEGDYGRVENGFFIPEKEGETTLTVQGSWRGFEGVTLKKVLKVKIVSAFEFYVNDGTTIYTIHNKESVGTDYYGKTEIPFNVYCYDNGVEVENVNVEITLGEDIIAYDETTSTIKVLDEKTGPAKVLVTASDSKGTQYTLSFIITVYQSGPNESGYFNPNWLIEQEDTGKFNPDWII